MAKQKRTVAKPKLVKEESNEESQFTPLLNIHLARLLKAEEDGDSHKILTSSSEIRRIKTLIKEEAERKEGKV